MSRDAKRPTVVSLQLDKTGKHILITDLSGDAASIVAKDDKELLHETIIGIIENSQLMELSIASLTVTNNGATGNSGGGGFDVTDLGNLTNNPMGTILAQGLQFLQKNSTHGKK